MKEITQATDDAWRSNFKGGGQRAVMRATVQRLDVKLLNYDLSKFTGSYNYDHAAKPSTRSTNWTAQGTYSCAIFGQDDRPVEIPHLQSISWTRSIDQDVATCRITLLNTETVPIGDTQDASDEGGFDRPGYMTFRRGVSTESQTLWGHESNGWSDRLVPDRLIRTYEGYGVDYNVAPEDDPNMYPSGVWLIDSVQFGSTGQITIECRDIGRILIEQIFYPPVVPWEHYPVSFERFHKVDNEDIVSTKNTSSQSWFYPTYETDSNKPYVGKGYTDGSFAYVQSNGAVLGHHGSHAFDKNSTSYWLSVGNYPSWSSAFEYVQGKFSRRTIGAVRIKPWGGPYTVYVSVFANGAWQGSQKIPYKSQQVDTNADIKFVKAWRVGFNKDVTLKLPKAYTNATKIRITFTDLYDSGLGKYRWRAGCFFVMALGTTSSTVTTTTDGGYHIEGQYDDYTDLVKWFLSWSGWYWPETGTGYNYIRESNNTKVPIGFPFPGRDPVLTAGRVWGDFEQSGTGGISPLEMDIWDKKPIMDGISYIRDILGFVFFIDENGAAVWRSPNIWQLGNYVAGLGANSGRTNPTEIITIDEEETLLSLDVTVSSKNVRERIFISNSNGLTGALAAGYNPFPSGLRRISGWSDQHFETAKECQIMADMVALRQMFSYRSDRLTIPGNPAIQIDDQIKIIERVTDETYYHYVKSITSDWNADSGVWTYQLDTNWLGETPTTRWAFDRTVLAVETQQYLEEMNRI